MLLPKKLTLSSIIALATLLLTACHSSRHSQASIITADTLTFAYNNARELTQKDVAFFNKVCEAYGGLQYTPIWYMVSADEDGGELLTFFCRGQNGRDVTVSISKPARGKAVITEIKQTGKPRKPSDVVAVFYDTNLGSASLEAVLATMDCDILDRDVNAGSFTIRLRKKEDKTVLENTKGVLSVTDYQLMPPYNRGN